MLSYVYDWNIAEAEREFRRAIDLNPNYARTHIYYALMLSHTGRSQEGIEEIERARRLDRYLLYRRYRRQRIFRRPKVR